MEKQVRENISRIRQERNISQKAMADKLGISRVAYANLESGRTRILNEHIERFAEVTGVSPEEIVLGYKLTDDVHSLEQAQADYGRRRQEIIDKYEARIAELNKEITSLREQVADLHDLVSTKNEVINHLRSKLPPEE